MSKFTDRTSEIFYGEHKGKAFFPNLQNFIKSDLVVGMEIVAENAVDKWRGLIGPTNTLVARQ